MRTLLRVYEAPGPGQIHEAVVERRSTCQSRVVVLGTQEHVRSTVHRIYTQRSRIQLLWPENPDVYQNMHSHLEQLVHILRRDEPVDQDIRRAVLLDEVRADVEIKCGAFDCGIV